MGLDVVITTVNESPSILVEFWSKSSSSITNEGTTGLSHKNIKSQSTSKYIQSANYRLVFKLVIFKNVVWVSFLMYYLLIHGMPTSVTYITFN